MIQYIYSQKQVLLFLLRISLSITPIIIIVVVVFVVCGWFPGVSSQQATFDTLRVVPFDATLYI